jgi:hypothetical protein
VKILPLASQISTPVVSALMMLVILESILVMSANILVGVEVLPLASYVSTPLVSAPRMLVNMAHTLENVVGSMMVVVVLTTMEDFPNHDDSGVHLERAIFLPT